MPTMPTTMVTWGAFVVDAAAIESDDDRDEFPRPALHVRHHAAAARSATTTELEKWFPQNEATCEYKSATCRLVVVKMHAT